MTNLSSNALRVVMVIVGALIIYVGINVGFGGIRTLGLQGTTEFVEVTNEGRFLAQDSHVRFLGGVFGTIGLFFLLAATNLHKYKLALKVVLVLVFIGGLARFSSLGVVFSPDVVGSVAVEIVLMPILYLWVSSVEKQLRVDSV